MNPIPRQDVKEITSNVGDENWEYRLTIGDCLLKSEPMVRLCQEVRKEQREKSEVFFRFAPMLIGLLGALIGVLALLTN